MTVHNLHDLAVAHLVSVDVISMLMVTSETCTCIADMG